MEALAPSAEWFGPVAALAAVATVLAVVFVILVSQQRRRLARLSAERAQVASEAAELARLLGDAPVGLCRWRPDGEWRNQQVDDLFGERHESVEDAIAARLRFEDAEQALAAVSSLRANSEPFDLAAHLIDGSGVLQLSGRISADGFPLLWLRDASGEQAELDRLEQQIDSQRRDSENLRTLLDALPVPVWRRNADLAIDWCNAAYAIAVGSGRGEMLADRRELGAGVIGDDGRALAKRVQRSGLPQSESHHITIDGARRLIDFNERPLGDGQTMIGFGLDVTDVESTQADLADHIAAHGEVLERLNSAIAIYGADRRLRFFNNAFAELWGLNATWLSSEPAIGEVMEDLRQRRKLPEYVDFRAFKAELQGLFTSLLETREELLHLPDGSTLRESVSPHPMGGLIFVYEDFTDRLEVERQYNTLIEVQRETLNNLHEALAVFGSDGRLKLSNPAFAKLWGFTPSELDGEPHITDLVDRTRGLFEPDSEWPTIRAKLIGSVIAPEAKAGRLQRTDGKVLDFATIPLPDGAVIFSYIDRTDSVRIEQALMDRNEALVAADRLKTQFIANVSYELRTPLNAILGFAELLSGVAGELSSERRSTYAEGILKASGRLMTLINDILDLATIEGGYMSLALGEIEVSKMFDSVRLLTRERARERGVELRFRTAKELDTIVVDEKRIRQVLFNLVSNALQFTPSGGRIMVRAKRDGDDAVLEVSDTGPGIPESDQERVFGLFERGRGGQGGDAGAGLGLALVKRFIELHGGTVSMVSAPDSGTTVTCRVPVHPVQVDEAEPPLAVAADD
ncbi:MAG: ATP-binding protein [Alphaproteobacteria bacterium]|nr:ATP-binding protein [Alphaproteobacteria bacterium]